MVVLFSPVALASAVPAGAFAERMGPAARFGAENFQDGCPL